jgi:hypothetical protein
MEHISFRIEEDYLEKLEKYAKIKHIPIRTALRSLLSEKLDELIAPSILSVIPRSSAATGTKHIRTATSVENNSNEMPCSSAAIGSFTLFDKSEMMA